MAFVDVLRQFLEDTLRRLNITSANPVHINKVMDIDINPTDFESVFEEDLRRAVEEYAQSQEGQDQARKQKQEQESLGLSDINRFAARGVSGPPDVMGTFAQFIPQLAPIMIASGAAVALFEWAKGPGGPIDTRYRRELTNEILNFQSRQLQRDTEIGLRQVIIQTGENFRNLGGAGSSNTFRQIQQQGGRLANVGLLTTDSASGLERLES